MSRKRIFMVNQTDESNRYGVGRYIEAIIDEVINRENTFELVIITIGVKGVNGVEIKTEKNLTYLDIPCTVHNLGGITRLSFRYSQAIFCLLNDYFSFSEKDIFHFNSNMQHFLLKEVKKNTQSQLIYTMHVSLWKVLYNNDYDKFIQEFSKEIENYKINNIKAEQKNCELADIIICLTDEMKNDVINLYRIPGKKIRKVDNGLRKGNHESANTDKLNIIRGALNILGGDFIMLYVGRMIPQKGVEYLFKSLEKLKQQGVDQAKLVLIGDGNMRDRMEKEYSKFIDNYRFVGYISPNELELYYQMADVILFPSLNEQSSYVMIEAMKYKVPLLVTDIEAFKVLEDEKSCIKIKPTPAHEIDVNDLTKKIKSIIYNQELGIRIADNAYRLYEKKYTSDRMFQLTYSV